MGAKIAFVETVQARGGCLRGDKPVTMTQIIQEEIQITHHEGTKKIKKYRKRISHRFHR